MTKRDWFWAVVWALALIGAFGLAGRDDYDRAKREAAYYDSRQVER